MKRLAVFVAVVAVAALLASCADQPPPSDLIAIPTAAAPSGEPGCRLRLNSGTLVADEDAGVAVQGSAVSTIVVVWPHGWYAEDRDGVRTLLDADGHPVARVGDVIKFGGAEGADGRVRACGEITRIQ
jgi:hypothetical protein